MIASNGLRMTEENKKQKKIIKGDKNDRVDFLFSKALSPSYCCCVLLYLCMLCGFVVFLIEIMVLNFKSVNFFI